MSFRVIQLLEPPENKLVEAKLIDTLKPHDLELVERAWTPERDRLLREYLLRGIDRRAYPQSLHWRWDKKARHLRELQARATGILVGDAWQGVMLTKSATQFARLQPDRGKPLVYIDYIEAAPWNLNLPDIGQQRRYRGVGPVLVREAILQSQREGFHGRLGLHSLPQSEHFYTGCGMTGVERDAAKQNLLYFEMTREAATRYMENEVSAT